MSRPEGWGEFVPGVREQDLAEQARSGDEEAREAAEEAVRRARAMPWYCGCCGRELAARQMCPACGDET